MATFDPLNSNNLVIAQGLTNNGQASVTLFLNVSANTLNIVDDNSNVNTLMQLSGSAYFQTGVFNQTGLTASFAATGLTFSNLPTFYPAQYQTFLSGGVVYVATKA